MNPSRSILAFLLCVLMFSNVMAASAAISINIQDPSFQVERSEAYKQFMKQYPKAKIHLKKNPDQQGNLFLQQQLVNQSEDYDVFYTINMSNALKSIVGRGYYEPLQHEAEIEKYTQSMVPAVRKTVMQGDDLVLLPVDTYLPYVFMLNSDLLEKIGMSRDEIPKTFFDVLTFMKEWPDKYGGRFPEITPFHASVGNPLLELRNFTAAYMLRAYLYTMIATGDPVRFDTPLFRRLLAETAFLTKSAKAELAMDDYMGDPPQWHNTVFYMIWGSSPFYTPAMEIISPPPLAEGLPIVQPMSLVNAHLNPYRKAKDDALLWLSYQAKYPDPVVARTLGLTDSPLEHPGLDPNKMPKDDYSRYRISPKQIADYHERLVPYLLITGQSAVEAPGFLVQAEDLYIQYLDGALPEELFIQQLDNIIKLIDAEG